MIDGRVVDKPVDHASRGRLRALYEWLKPATPFPYLLSSPAGAPDRGDPPARVGHYAIERKLGQGGMGVVYAARDERLKRTVALKMMSSLAHDELARTRFWREARVAASVNHPNVCQIYEIGEDHGALFIAMELLEGEALSERLRNGPLAVADALPIEFGILAALSALHARGIVHRDLKPSNVFLTPHSVKLLDFGLARPEREPWLHSATSVTHSGTVLGTPSYMAPEQLTSGVVDSASTHQGVFCGPDSLGQSVVRSAAERFTLPGDPGRSGGGPAASAGRFPRSRRRATPRPVTH
jgi:serine/threonine protein kinase